MGRPVYLRIKVGRLDLCVFSYDAAKLRGDVVFYVYDAFFALQQAFEVGRGKRINHAHLHETCL